MIKIQITLITSILMINSLLSAMELSSPQQQLIPQAQPFAQKQPIHGQICITKTIYHPGKLQQKWLNKIGIEVSPYDLCSRVILSFDTKEEQKFPQDNKYYKRFLLLRIIPVKQLLPLSSGSTLELNICGKPVELLCTGNLLIDKAPLQEQLIQSIELFCIKTSEWAQIAREAVDEFPADIIIKAQNAPDDVRVVEHTDDGGTITYTKEHSTYEMGLNGCPSILHLAKVILNERNEKIGQPQQDSLFSHIIKRQTGQKNKKYRSR